MTPRETLLSMGMKAEEIDSHYSDLYVLKNETSTRFIEGYEWRCNVTTFVSQIDKKVWYELPFADHEYTEKRLEKLRKIKG
jgi:hypothetical protein